MTIHPCEARKYLGIGAQDEGELGQAGPTCGEPIQWRMSFFAPDAEAPSGERRVAIAYFCTTHRDQVVCLMDQHGDYLSDHLTGVDVRAYTPRTSERVLSTPAAVRSNLAATRASLMAGEL